MHSKSARTIGIIISTVLGTFAVGLLLFLIKEKRKSRVKVDRGIRGGKGVDDEWGFAAPQMNNGSGRVSQNYVVDVASPSSKLFPYANSGIGQYAATGPSSVSRPPAVTTRSTTGRYVVPGARSRTPSPGDRLEPSLEDSLLPAFRAASEKSLNLTRVQTTESGRVV